MNSSVLRIFLLAPLVAIVLLSVPTLAQDVVVIFPDPVLDAAIREAISKSSGDILESDLLGLESLTAQGVADLTGIEHCSDLTRLILEYGSINDISPLPSLTKLTELSLKDNMIGDISSLSGLTGLTWLNIDGNQISSITPISDLTRLDWLAIADNNITDISPLYGLTELETLWAWGNGIEDISPLQGLTDLRFLNIESNRIEDISPLQDLTDLDWLNIESNQISSIAPLSDLRGLNWLSIADNNITDISPLYGLTELETLHAWNNRIEDISPLLSLSRLVTLDLAGNPLSADSCSRYIPQLVERAVDVHHGCEPSPSLPWMWLSVGAVAVIGTIGVIATWVRRHVMSRATKSESGNEVTHDPVEVDENLREVFLDGRVLRPQLKGNEFAFISLLYQNLGKAVSHDRIIEHVWQSTQSQAGMTRQDVHQLASRVRNSLGKDTYGRYIVTIPTFGYRLDREVND